MGNLVSNDGTNGNKTFSSFKNQYCSADFIDSHDFPNKNCEILHQKTNKDNRVIIISHWLQSKYLTFLIEDEFEMDLLTKQFNLKSKWDHYSICKPVLFDSTNPDTQFNCFDNGLGCKVVFLIGKWLTQGIGTFQGLITRASNSNKINEIHLHGLFKFEKSPQTPENILLSEAQVYFILQRLTEVGLYYKQKNQFHGDFHPANVSKNQTPNNPKASTHLGKLRCWILICITTLPLGTPRWSRIKCTKPLFPLSC
jgi:hypothetical protein